jgi:hypothetical protein
MLQIFTAYFSITFVPGPLFRNNGTAKGSDTFPPEHHLHYGLVVTIVSDTRRKLTDEQKEHFRGLLKKISDKLSYFEVYTFVFTNATIAASTSFGLVADKKCAPPSTTLSSLFLAPVKSSSSYFAFSTEYT